ncbi:hypothetical protein DFP72DRAFT_816799 [Ephemerocybe angulata]|uniref:RING-type domain-containing protein n=1 Tax=Ephemerocybe angulata TaxID=980116 RepID=A0A8H6HSW8_9AGAR|nr:hypothetical protein DFP72DRAFT_816799 [Tulosesus angulatus]
MVLHLLGTYSPEETASLVVDHLLEHTRASSPDDHPQHLGANSSDPGPSVEAPEDPTTRLPHELDFKADNDVDCECCFVPSPSTHMLRCPDGHPFCFRCVETHVATQVGQQKIDVVCMYSGDAGCHLRFTLDVLQAQLPEPLLTTYLRLIQQKELKEANLEGLEECPFCDFACVMEIPLRVMPTLSCGNVEHCGVQSCRICRLKAHPGRTCEDTQGDGDQDGRLAIEEAMTRALVRMCPSCGTPFVKEDGCNKMTCPSCGAFSCYVCKEPVRGYGHFEGHDNIYGVRRILNKVLAHQTDHTNERNRPQTPSALFGIKSRNVTIEK